MERHAIDIGALKRDEIDFLKNNSKVKQIKSQFQGNSIIETQEQVLQKIKAHRTLRKKLNYDKQQIQDMKKSEQKELLLKEWLDAIVETSSESLESGITVQSATDFLSEYCITKTEVDAETWNQWLSAAENVINHHSALRIEKLQKSYCPEEEIKKASPSNLMYHSTVKNREKFSPKFRNSVSISSSISERMDDNNKKTVDKRNKFESNENLKPSGKSATDISTRASSLNSVDEDLRIENSTKFVDINNPLRININDEVKDSSDVDQVQEEDSSKQNELEMTSESNTSSAEVEAQMSKMNGHDLRVEDEVVQSSSKSITSSTYSDTKSIEVPIIHSIVAENSVNEIIDEPTSLYSDSSSPLKPVASNYRIDKTLDHETSIQNLEADAMTEDGNYRNTTPPSTGCCRKYFGCFFSKSDNNLNKGGSLKRQQQHLMPDKQYSSDSFTNGDSEKQKQTNIQIQLTRRSLTS